MKPARRALPVAVIGLLVTLGGCAGSAGPDGPSPAAKQDGPFKPYGEVLKDTEAHEGLFTVHVKRDRSMFMEIAPEQLGREYGMLTHYSRGTGVYNLQDGLSVGGTRLIRWDRHGDKLYLVEVNARFTAAEGTPMRASLEDNTGHSILAAFDIQAEHDSTKALVIETTPFFVGDFVDIADNLKNYHGNQPVAFDKARSYLDRVLTFPENVEIDALLTFRASDPPTVSSGAGVSDYRSIPVGLRYSIFALPETPMRRRLADDRVGYFLSAQRDFSRDRMADPYVRYVNRWRLEKKDPSARVSEPVEPIVYYVDRSVPDEYRPYVKEGIEAWNKAFEAAGFRNAIVAKDPPEDEDWSAEDVRYSTVRWTAAHEMGYAIGPSQVDPRTGEILNADILVSSTFVTGWANEWAEMAGPIALALGEDAAAEASYWGGLWGRLMAGQALARDLPEGLREQLCLAAIGKAHQLGFQHAALSALGEIDGTAPMPDTYLRDAVRDLIMHEVGHTLGLRHNFKASSAVPWERINDRDFTRANGVSVSVMDYNATNIAAQPAKQGYYVNPEVGSYDVWAITYGYATVPGAETPAEEIPVLREIAGRAPEPLLAYNTDEDAHLGPLAIDPNSSTWDLSADPMAFARDRAQLVDRIWPEIEDRLIADGDGWQRLRSAVPGLLFERYGSLVPVTKAIGGIHFTRDHKGDPDGRMPFEPVPADRQRAALQLIIDEAFAPGALEIGEETLNKMAPSRWSTSWQWSWGAPIDYPVHSTVAALQGSLLGQIMHNGRLIRMIDNEVRMPGGTEAFTVAEMFGTLTDEIWTEIGLGGARPVNVDSYRRNLQRAYLDELVAKALDRVQGTRNSFNPSTPEDARSLARYEMERLSRRIGQIQGDTRLDRVTRAHLGESKARIDRALDASLVVEDG
jgi:hypothetical protein